MIFYMFWVHVSRHHTICKNTRMSHDDLHHGGRARRERGRAWWEHGQRLLHLRQVACADVHDARVGVEARRTGGSMVNGERAWRDSMMREHGERARRGSTAREHGERAWWEGMDGQRLLHVRQVACSSIADIGWPASKLGALVGAW